jgi:ribosomal protein S21
MALKRFRREVMSAGLMQEVRRRRYFENSVGERWES